MLDHICLQKEKDIDDAVHFGIYIRLRFRVLETTILIQ